jgi:excisionase family DNA binding protein
MDMGKLLSTTEVAKRLGITVPRVQTFIWEERLPAIRVGRSYAIDEDDLKFVADRKVGRPPKPKDEKASKVGKKGSKK